MIHGLKMFYNQEIETLSKDRLRQLQNDRLVDLLRNLNQSVPFYQNSFSKEGIEIDRIKHVEDLHKLPFTKKDDLRDNYPFGLMAVPMDEINRIHCSSGTTGKPTVVGYTKQDIEIFTEVVARSLVTAGAKPGMKLHNAYGYGLFTGGLGLHYGAEKLGMSVIPVSGGMTDRQLMLLEDFRSEVISCTPSYALTLAEEVKKRGVELNLKYAVLGAEPWTDSLRMEVERGLGVKATNIYGLSEIIGPGVSQEDYEEQSGSHIWEDHFFPEIVDRDSGEPLAEGKDGVLVFTTLTKTGMPLLRYWTNDITHLFYDSDSKRSHIKMGPIKGRADDMLIIRGVNLFHTQVEELLQDDDNLSTNYQLVVTRKGNLDQVEVKVELQEKLYSQIEFSQADEMVKNTGSLLAERIKNNLGLSMIVSIVNKNEVPRSVGGKLSRIDDQRN